MTVVYMDKMPCEDHKRSNRSYMIQTDEVFSSRRLQTVTQLFILIDMLWLTEYFIMENNSAEKLGCRTFTSMMRGQRSPCFRNEQSGVGLSNHTKSMLKNSPLSGDSLAFLMFRVIVGWGMFLMTVVYPIYAKFKREE